MPQRVPTDDLPIYLLLVIRGLEFLVIKEIHATLQVEFLEIGSIEADDNDPYRDIYQGEAASGRIYLQTKSSASLVRSLHSVQAILALIAKSDNLIVNDMKGVAQIEELVVKANWAPALSAWKEHMSICRDPTVFDPNIPPKFRASCVRDGRHAFKSIEIAAEMGGGINDLFSWPVDLVHPDLEVVCFVYYQHVVVGISLLDPTKSLFRNRFANEERSLLVDSRYMCTLRPSTAYLMLQIATYTQGDVLLDGMCGIGTIPIYSMAFARPQLMVALGGDNDAEAVQKAGVNAASELIQKQHYVGICQWDSTRLPVRDCCIDKAIIDLPFGIRCGTPREQRKLYPPMMKELFRVLRPGGRAVLLTTLRKTFQTALDAAPFKIKHTYDVSVGGVRGLIYVLDKAK